MNAKFFTTLDLPKSQQLDAWRRWFDLFDVQSDAPIGDFRATSETWNFGKFSLSRVKAPRLLASRTAKHIRRDSIDHWNIAIGQKRTLADAGGNRSIDVPAGVPFAASLGREIISFRDEDERLQLYLPRDAFPDLTPAFEAAEGRPLTDQMGVLLAEFIELLGRSAPEIPETHAPALQTAIHAMLLACITPSQDNSILGAAPIAMTKKAIIRRIVDQNLHRSDLTPELLCREAAMSRSQLYRLFENEGGVKAYIQRERLRRCFDELTINANSRSILSIGEEFGFADASSFSRAFKREFGLTPSEARHANLSDAPFRPTHIGRANAETSCLADILRQTAWP
jgi:AraC-like DNA-binding protein